MVRIKSIGVIKSASFLSIFITLTLLVFGIISFLIIFIGYLLIPNFLGDYSFPLLGFILIIVIPLIFGIFAFISSIIFVPLINLSLKIVSGIDSEIDFDI